MTEKVGLIGPGIMGQPMGMNLINAGYSLWVFSRTPDRAQPLVDAGATRCDTPRSVTEQADIIISIVSDTPDVEAVVLDENGVLEGASAGKVLVDMSTISPIATRKISAALEEKGMEMLDAPVTGGAVGAQNATLSIFVGGDADSFERCKPVLETLGASVMHMGAGGMGHTAKLANQILGATCMMGVAEAFVFAHKAGLDLDTFYEAATRGAGDSWHLRTLGPKIIEGDFAPGFMAKHMRKDLRLAVQSASEVDAPTPISAAIGQLYGALSASGRGEEGHHAIVRVIEMLAQAEARG